MFYSQEGLRSCRCVFGQCKVAPRVIFRLLSPILFSHPPLGTLGRGTGEKSCLVICCHWQCRMVFYVVKIEKHEAYSIKASLVEDPLPFSNPSFFFNAMWRNNTRTAIVLSVSGLSCLFTFFYPDDKSVSIMDKVVEVFFCDQVYPDSSAARPNLQQLTVTYNTKASNKMHMQYTTYRT